MVKESWWPGLEGGQEVTRVRTELHRGRVSTLLLYTHTAPVQGLALQHPAAVLRPAEAELPRPPAPPLARAPLPGHREGRDREPVRVILLVSLQASN